MIAQFLLFTKFPLPDTWLVRNSRVLYTSKADLRCPDIKTYLTSEFFVLTEVPLQTRGWFAVVLFVLSVRCQMLASVIFVSVLTTER